MPIDYKDPLSVLTAIGVPSFAGTGVYVGEYPNAMIVWTSRVGPLYVVDVRRSGNVLPVIKRSYHTPEEAATFYHNMVGKVHLAEALFGWMV